METQLVTKGNGACIHNRKVNKRQRAKKVVSDSPGLVDFAIGLVNFALNFLEEFKLQTNFEINSAHQNV